MLMQQWSDYESIYNNSMYGGGGISPSKSTKSGLSTCSPVLAHHYISSVRASMRGSASSTPERDPCVRLQLLLKKRYLQLSLNRPVIGNIHSFHTIYSNLFHFFNYLLTFFFLIDQFIHSFDFFFIYLFDLIDLFILFYLLVN